MIRDFLQSSAVWGTVLTMALFALGTWISKRTGKAIFNPLLVATVMAILILRTLDIPYADFKASAAPISYLLLPATVSLAVPLYEKWDLLRRNAVPIVLGILSGVIASIGCILILAWVFRMDRAIGASLLTKSVTTAIGMDVAGELGGIPALAGAMIILTGITGNLIAETVCRLFRITDPTARGIGIGTASHAIGTARALEMGDVEGAMSGLAIAVAGLMTAVLAPLAANLLP